MPDGYSCAEVESRPEVYDPFVMCRRVDRALDALGNLDTYTKRLLPGSVAHEAVKAAYEAVLQLRADLANDVDVTGAPDGP